MTCHDCEHNDGLICDKYGIRITDTDACDKPKAVTVLELLEYLSGFDDNAEVQFILKDDKTLMHATTLIPGGFLPVVGLEIKRS